MPVRYFERQIAARLSELKENDHLRKLRSVGGVNLCSNDYLGLASDVRLRSAIIQAVDSCDRVASTGSRLLSGHANAWDALENNFAAFAGTEAALFFNSGTAANIGLLQSLLNPKDVVFSDESNHASIIDGIRLSHNQKVVYPHCDMTALEDGLRLVAHRPGGRLIVTESVFSMGGDRAPLPEIFQLAEKYGADVIVDEAHATCVLGPSGRGLVAEHGYENRCLAIVHTCGKALASPGAFVCGSESLIQHLINSARSFIFSTALPPYIAGQVQAALHLALSMDRERMRLSDLAGQLRSRLREMEYDCRTSTSQIIPVIIGSNRRALEFSQVLAAGGFAVKPIRSPSVPPGTERLRLSVTAQLTEDEIKDFVSAMAPVSGLGVAHG